MLRRDAAMEKSGKEGLLIDYDCETVLPTYESDFELDTDDEVNDDKPVGKSTKAALKKVKKSNESGAEGSTSKPTFQTFDTSLAPSLKQPLRVSRQVKAIAKRTPVNRTGASAAKAVPKENSKLKSQLKTTAPSYTKAVPKTTVQATPEPSPKFEKRPAAKPVLKKAGATSQVKSNINSPSIQKNPVKDKAEKKNNRTNPDLTPYTGYSKFNAKGGVAYNYTLGQPKKVVTKKAAVKRSPPKEKYTEQSLSESFSRQSTFIKDSDAKSIAETDANSEILGEYESDFEDPSESEASVPIKNEALATQEEKELSKVDYSKQDKGKHKSDLILDSRPQSSYQELIAESKAKSSSRTSTPRQVRHVNKGAEGKRPKNAEEFEKNDADNDEEIVDYDDDFEDYESDFEDDTESGFTSSDENQISAVETASDTDSELKKIKPQRMHVVVEDEKKMDSGSYDLSSKMIRSDILRSSQLKEIKEAISRENTIYNERPNELKIFKKTEASQRFQLSNLNFKAALQNDAVTKAILNKRNAVQKRGQILLEMITLQPISFHIYDMLPIPYNEFIRMYGKKNTLQNFTQTNDDSISTDIQTDLIVKENKWTQCPVEYHRWEGNGNDLAVYLHDKNGVGGDDMYDSILGRNRLLKKYNYNTQQLNNFILSAGQVMLIILEEEMISSKKNQLTRGKIDYGFSDGFISMMTNEINFLKGRLITNLVFSPHNPLIFLSCHQTSIEFGSTFIDQYYGRCIVCIWNILQPSQPLKFLVASDEITSLCFDSSYDYLIYAGLNDGTICAWDLTERTEWHQQNIAVDMPFILRSPTYCSFYAQEDNDEAKHYRPIISIKSIGFTQLNDLASSVKPPTRLVTLSQDTKCIIWTVLHCPNADVNLNRQIQEGCTAPWGRIKLICNTVLDPKKNLVKNERNDYLELNCMALISNKEFLRILLGTNIGYVINCNSIGSVPETKLFGNYDTSLGISCIEPNSHLYNIFLVGYDDGNVTLFNIDRSKPLRTFTSHPEMVGSPVVNLKWCSFKVGLFFVMDNESSVYVWDICKGDVFPQFSVPLKRKSATNMDISCDSRFPYLAMSLKKSQLCIHRIKDEFISKETSFESEFQLLKDYLFKL
ncbi:WD repeat-containing protein 60 isoform X2 [Cimex lectularius]|uniref:WD repeat-containing protein 60 n=1 Tax=Cimex lectularius TaxID=79782 RepID=A0A8I6S1D9_CIMLE|nr:WD repeat-containing protein 60 isoform X2 [Cimex lectularius]